MKLGKPPVVEVSIEFLFEASNQEPEWEFAKAAEFLGQFQAEYPETEVATQQMMEEVQKFSRGAKLPTFKEKRVPIATRAYPADRSRYILNAKDVLQCIFLRTAEQPYQGFTALRKEAMKTLAAYVAFFRPAKLIAFNLRYVDFFRLPVVDGKAELREFFTICGEPNEKIFGTTVVFRKSFATKLPGSDDLLTCEVYNSPKPKEQRFPGIPFRMEWGLHAYKDVSLEPETIEARLTSGHDRVLHCFWESFTDKGRALFDPLESEAL